MRICFRVGKSNSLSVLRQLKIYGSRYKIEKIQKLTENFEKACWRSVRTAEERAYMQKYRFLKHCLNVINSYRQNGSFTHSTLTTNIQPSLSLSQYIIDIYDHGNSKYCLETAKDLLNYVTKKYHNKDSEEHGKNGSEVVISENIKPIIDKLDMKTININESDIKKLKNIINKLKQEVNLINKHGNNPDITGYSRKQLQDMIKL